jgi:hypothetical protein
MLTKEKSRQKRKCVNNQNNSSSYFRLLTLINLNFSSFRHNFQQLIVENFYFQKIAFNHLFFIFVPK